MISLQPLTLQNSSMMDRYRSALNPGKNAHTHTHTNLTAVTHHVVALWLWCEIRALAQWPTHIAFTQMLFYCRLLSCWSSTNLFTNKHIIPSFILIQFFKLLFCVYFPSLAVGSRSAVRCVKWSSLLITTSRSLRSTWRATGRSAPCAANSSLSTATSSSSRSTSSPTSTVTCSTSSREKKYLPPHHIHICVTVNSHFQQHVYLWAFICRELILYLNTVV